MKKYYIFLLMLLLTTLPAFNQELISGDSLTVSLITCEPGKALYAKFGHTALRIKGEKELDLVFNYGVFDFKTKGFYWKFIRGHTDYMLAVYPFEYFLEDYQKRNSSVWEQVLDLNAIEKQQLITLLSINYQPENRMYRYNFIYDNCSTRPYDILNKAVQGVVTINMQYEVVTARELINSYIKDAPWSMVGINLAFGTDADKMLPLNVQVFLPEYLQDIMQSTHLVDVVNNHTETPIVMEVNKLVEANPEDAQKVNWLLHPITIGLILLLIGIALIVFYKDMDHISHKIFDTSLFTILGLGGVLLFFLMFFSEHPLTGKNLSLLWINPLNLLLIVFVWVKKTRKYFFFYNIIYLLFIVISYLATVFITHSAILEIMPFQALLLVRILWREERLFHVLLEPGKKGLRWR